MMFNENSENNEESVSKVFMWMEGNYFLDVPHKGEMEKEKDEDVEDEEVADEEVADEDVAIEEVVDEDVADEDVADEEVADEDVAIEEVVDEDVADEDVADEDVAIEEVVDKEVVDEEVVDEKVEGEKVEGEKVEGEKVNIVDVAADEGEAPEDEHVTLVKSTGYLFDNIYNEKNAFANIVENIMIYLNNLKKKNKYYNLIFSYYRYATKYNASDDYTFSKKIFEKVNSLDIIQLCISFNFTNESLFESLLSSYNELNLIELSKIYYILFDLTNFLIDIYDTFKEENKISTQFLHNFFLNYKLNYICEEKISSIHKYINDDNSNYISLLNLLLNYCMNLTENIMNFFISIKNEGASYLSEMIIVKKDFYEEVLKYGGANERGIQCGGADEALLKCGGTDREVFKCGDADEVILKCGGTEEVILKGKGTYEPIRKCGSVDESIRRCGSVDEPVRKCGSVDESIRRCGSVDESIRRCESVDEPIRRYESVDEPILKCSHVDKRHCYKKEDLIEEEHSSLISSTHYTDEGKKERCDDFFENCSDIKKESSYEYHKEIRDDPINLLNCMFICSCKENVVLLRGDRNENALMNNVNCVSSMNHMNCAGKIGQKNIYAYKIKTTNMNLNILKNSLCVLLKAMKITHYLNETIYKKIFLIFNEMFTGLMKCLYKKNDILFLNYFFTDILKTTHVMILYYNEKIEKSPKQTMLFYKSFNKLIDQICKYLHNKNLFFEIYSDICIESEHAHVQKYLHNYEETYYELFSLFYAIIAKTNRINNEIFLFFCCAVGEESTEGEEAAEGKKYRPDGKIGKVGKNLITHAENTKLHNFEDAPLYMNSSFLNSYKEKMKGKNINKHITIFIFLEKKITKFFFFFKYMFCFIWVKFRKGLEKNRCKVRRDFQLVLKKIKYVIFDMFVKYTKLLLIYQGYSKQGIDMGRRTGVSVFDQFHLYMKSIEQVVLSMLPYCPNDIITKLDIYMANRLKMVMQDVGVFHECNKSDEYDKFDEFVSFNRILYCPDGLYAEGREVLSNGVPLNDTNLLRHASHQGDTEQRSIEGDKRRFNEAIYTYFYKGKGNYYESSKVGNYKMKGGNCDEPKFEYISKVQFPKHCDIKCDHRHIQSSGQRWGALPSHMMLLNFLGLIYISIMEEITNDKYKFVYFRKCLVHVEFVKKLQLVLVSSVCNVSSKKWHKDCHKEQYKERYKEQYKERYKEQYKERYKEQYKERYKEQYKERYKEQYKERYKEQYKERYKELHKEIHKEPLNKVDGTEIGGSDAGIHVDKYFCFPYELLSLIIISQLKCFMNNTLNNYKICTSAVELLFYMSSSVNPFFFYIAKKLWKIIALYINKNEDIISLSALIKILFYLISNKKKGSVIQGNNRLFKNKVKCNNNKQYLLYVFLKNQIVVDVSGKNYLFFFHTFLKGIQAEELVALVIRIFLCTFHVHLQYTLNLLLKFLNAYEKKVEKEESKKNQVDISVQDDGARKEKEKVNIKQMVEDDLFYRRNTQNDCSKGMPAPLQSSNSVERKKNDRNENTNEVGNTSDEGNTIEEDNVISLFVYFDIIKAFPKLFFDCNNEVNLKNEIQSTFHFFIYVNEEYNLLEKRSEKNKYIKLLNKLKRTNQQFYYNSAKIYFPLIMSSLISYSQFFVLTNITQSFPKIIVVRFYENFFSNKFLYTLCNNSAYVQILSESLLVLMYLAMTCKSLDERQKNNNMIHPRGGLPPEDVLHPQVTDNNIRGTDENNKTYRARTGEYNDNMENTEIGKNRNSMNTADVDLSILSCLLKVYIIFLEEYPYMFLSSMLTLIKNNIRILKNETNFFIFYEKICNELKQDGKYSPPFKLLMLSILDFFFCNNGKDYLNSQEVANAHFSHFANFASSSREREENIKLSQMKRSNFLNVFFQNSFTSHSLSNFYLKNQLSKFFQKNLKKYSLHGQDVENLSNLLLVDLNKWTNI
ncbi:conserved Plasmodium protein, unknown function [Plasmodium malariae]|uniref:Uncharacterized protein n=1 Tax=Plasmodium malariae TaxID=5858 RepID=A0A1D3JMI0_PLAMA|nr:conserved Plasmodium protein, unknown function [Plasmodium malariae]SBT87857.1 conserved Plasmodium protein, unknown function [Plasmodium malariae]